MLKGKLVTTPLKGRFPSQVTTCPPCADGVAKNTEGTTIATVPSGGQVIVPNINIGSLPYPAAKDLTWSWANAVSVAGGIGYNYPKKTGIVSPFRDWDDNYVARNVYTDAVRATNGLKPHNETIVGAPRTMLNNNAFGNTLRFTDSVGSQNADGTGGSIIDYAIDHDTGFGIYLVWSHTSKNWNAMIDFGPSLTIGGLTGFFLSNVEQYQAMMAQESTIGNTLDFWPFTKNGTPVGNFVTSTTRRNVTTDALTIVTGQGLISTTGKSTSNTLAIFIRKHY